MSVASHLPSPLLDDDSFASLVDSAMHVACDTPTGTKLAPPRMAVAVVADGAVTAFCGRDATADTPFRIASMTKSFTAAAVLQLCERGVWRLDDLVSRWVPETLAFRAPTTDSPPVTLRHLLTMSAGLATDDPWGDRQLHLSANAFRALMQRGATFAFPAATAFQYSNFGYAVLGEAIFRATRLSPQKYISTEILAPLGMTNTTWDAPASAALPTHEREDLTETHPLADGAFAPMGGLWSTVSDLGSWVGFLADAFPARNDTDSVVLSRAARREMQQVHTSWPPTVIDTARGVRLSEVGYGMGLMIMQHPVLGKVVHHSGGLPGYGSNMRWVPDYGVGLIALGNRTYSPMRLLTAELLESLVERRVISAPVRRWPLDGSILEAAGAQLIEAVWGGDAVDLAKVDFAENVDLDLPLSIRSEEASQIRLTVGALSDWAITPKSTTLGTLTGQSATHTVSITIMLSPHVPPQIQHVDFTVHARPDAGLRNDAG
jgi:CubicO group peptidase (beta-lactamase class C family)